MGLASVAPRAGADGSPWAWGYNAHGQLGDGTKSAPTTPVRVAGSAALAGIATGSSHSLAVGSDGTAWAWGNNIHYQLGDGTGVESLTPVQVPGLTGVVGVAAGYLHSVALRSDGTVWAWGINLYGQVGDGTTADAPTPVQVIGLSDITAVACGGWHSLALKSDGTVWAWGYNGTSQLGDGSQADRLTPVQVHALEGATAIAGGVAHSLALKGDGSVWGWGANSWGQLGDGTAEGRSEPVPVLGLTTATSIAAGGYHSLARSSGGGVFSWGWNSEGQLGDGTDTFRTVPVAVVGLSGAVSIAGGYAHSVALGSDGRVWAWGQNLYNQLGDGSGSASSYVPVAVAGLVEITAIASGYDHNLCIGPLVRSATSLYAPSRTGLITTTVALKAYLKRTTDNAWLAGKTVAFSVAGSSVGSAATDAGGQATLNYVIATSAGTHTIGVSYAGDASYQPCATSAALTATTTNTKVYVVDRTAKVKTYTVLKSYLYTPTNALIPGKPMVLKLDGTTLASGNTNTSGYLQVGYTVAEGAGVGVRTIRGEFPGDGGYMASANTGKLTVTAGDLYIWPYVRSGKRGTNHLLKAYVRSLPDYVIQPGKSITFKVNGSEIGTSAVGSDGWASATWAIPADEPTGAHTAAAEFAGDTWYKAVTANTPFNVVL